MFDTCKQIARLCTFIRSINAIEVVIVALWLSGKSDKSLWHSDKAAHSVDHMFSLYFDYL